MELASHSSKVQLQTWKMYSFTPPTQSSSEALEVSTFIHKNAKKQTARFVGHLEIGDNLKIPCKMYTKVSVIAGS